MILNLAHYEFFDIAQPVLAQERLEELFKNTSVKGTVLIAREGVNFNLAGPPEELEETITGWLKNLGATDFKFKRSHSKSRPFKKLKIKVKPEIITMGQKDLDVKKLHSPHIAPGDFARVLENPGNHLILDARNDFEFEVGTFRHAQAAGMKSFRDFPQVASRLDKTRPVIMFCTGGVRCEKASALLVQQGFKSVQQLEGGILRYFEDQGKKHFVGSCFVFDERLALDGAEEAE